MNELFLGVIAVAVAVMAVIQVAAVVGALRASRRAAETVARLEDDIKPIVANLKSMSADAARAASIASTQAQKAEQLIGDLSTRVNSTVAAVEEAVIAPARDAYAMVQGLVAAFAAFRQGGAPATRRRPSTTEEEDSLFIG